MTSATEQIATSPQHAPARPAAAERLDWLDAAKGIGIILVVLGHVIGGIIDSDLSLAGLPLRELFLAIYIFHMPLFFLLSGLLVARRIERDQRQFLWTILRGLYLPYLLWSAIQLSIIVALGSLVNSPISDPLSEFLLLPIRPVSQFWFLLALALMHLLTLLLLPRIGAIGILLVALMLRSAAAFHDIPYIQLQALVYFYLFYAVGLLLTPAGIGEVLRNVRSRIVSAVLVLLALALLIATTHAVIGAITPPRFYQEAPRLAAASIANHAWTFLNWGAAFAMIGSVLILARRATGMAMRGLSSLGRLSLPIYILHVLFVAGARILLTKLLGVDEVAIVLPVILLAGIAGPVLAFKILDKARLARPLALA